jgi:hypothetical protein
MQQQLQQMLGRDGVPLMLALSYRIPDTNINVQYTHQQGRNNIVLSCIPDDQYPFLGPQVGMMMMMMVVVVVVVVMMMVVWW